MQIEKLPANSSRLFKTSKEAKVQPLGKLELGIHPNGHHVFNTHLIYQKSTTTLIILLKTLFISIRL